MGFLIIGGERCETFFKGGTNLDEAMPFIGIISLLRFFSFTRSQKYMYLSGSYIVEFLI